MRIVFLGANGQVASEVVMMLAGVAGVDVRSVVRSRGGSAFLRYHGIPVVHGDISKSEGALHLLSEAQLIAIFALAKGTPVESLARNNAIIRNTFTASPPNATIVFASSLAVHGQYDNEGREGRRTKSYYGKLKLKNEALVSALARQTGRKAYILRLGHVAGEFQNLTDAIRKQIASGKVVMIDPERASNVTHTDMIVEALLAIASGRAGPPGLYDLLDLPQWTWREVYEHEARMLHLPLKIMKLPQPRSSSLRSALTNLASRLGLRERILRGLAHLPGGFNASLTADYRVHRATAEIIALDKLQRPDNPAMYWPELPAERLAGLRRTCELINPRTYPIRVEGNGQFA